MDEHMTQNMMADFFCHLLVSGLTSYLQQLNHLFHRFVKSSSPSQELQIVCHFLTYMQNDKKNSIT